MSPRFAAVRLLPVLLVCAGLAGPVGAQDDDPLAAEDLILLQAALIGHHLLVSEALDQGADIEARAPNGDTALLLATQSGSLATVGILLSRRADPAAASAESLTALHHAADAGFTDIAKELIVAGAPLEAREGRFGNAPLHMAARQGHRAIIAALLDAGADIEARDGRRGNTPLVNAAFDPLALSALSELLARGARPDAAADDGITPLIAAVSRDNLGAVALLLEAGAPLEATDEAGYGALHHAAELGLAPSLGQLLAAGADPNRPAARRETPLGRAALSGHADVVEALLAGGARLEQPGRDGNRPLHQAARAGYGRIVELLLSRGAEADAPALGSGNTALMLAANRGFGDIVERLIAAGADVNAHAADGWTPLEAARMAGDPEVLAALQAAGARE